MSELVRTTFDWVPDAPRGYVRDLRVRWALEEAGLTYRVESTPFKHRGPSTMLTNPSPKCRGSPTATSASLRAAPSCSTSAR
jgi:hypothetical protein